MQRRDKAFFSFLMLTGARIGVAASLKPKHIDLADCHVIQDAREVATKAARNIDTWFFPAAAEYQACFEVWVNFLKQDKLFRPEDALFPKAMIGIKEGQGFTDLDLSREGYASTSYLNKIIRAVFADVQLPQYTPHNFRKTLFLYGDEVCNTMEELKAWSMNLGHEHLATSINSYLPVSTQRQRDLLKRFRK